MEELCLVAKEKHVEGRYGEWHDYLQYLHTHGRRARPPPGVDPYKMTWKIKFNFLLSLPRRQRRGNVNKVLKAELAKKKQLRKAAKSAANVTPANPYYQRQMQMMAAAAQAQQARSAMLHPPLTKSVQTPESAAVPQQPQDQQESQLNSAAAAPPKPQSVDLNGKTVAPTLAGQAFENAPHGLIPESDGKAVAAASNSAPPPAALPASSAPPPYLSF